MLLPSKTLVLFLVSPVAGGIKIPNIVVKINLGNVFYDLGIFAKINKATNMLMMTSVTDIPLKNCDGGHICSPPKECCRQGCCYLLAPSVSYRPPTLATTSMLNPLFLGHWYFWAAVTATVAGILCACSLWRRHSQRNLCCGGSGRDDRASEPDSNGSCYAPPHYSRCNSFHQAPPPYTEVTAKPDHYPLVISYNGYNLESNQKVGRGSTGYLMVQYFRNYIVRPVGTLSATSTMDSLGSSFICNAANEENTIIPPPYSCTGSLEEVNINNGDLTRSSSEFPRSISSATCNDFHLVQHSPSGCSQNGNVPTSQISTNNAINTSINNKHKNSPTNQTLNTSTSNSSHNNNSNSNTNNNFVAKEVSIINNPCYTLHNSRNNYQNEDLRLVERVKPSPKLTGNNQNHCDCVKKFAHKTSYGSNSYESQDDDHNFSDLLNLSVCIPSTITQLPLGTMTSGSQSNDLHQYSVVNSITSSDVSSLANLGTPDSPPRATSPTAELRELLDKIQQLPQRRSPNTETSNFGHEPKRNCFARNKDKTLYMPLNEGSPNHGCLNRLSPNSTNTTIVEVFGKGPKKNWMSRSAPTTPCGNFVPNFPIIKKQSCSQKGSKGKITDGSPLLINESDESEDSEEEQECS